MNEFDKNFHLNFSPLYATVVFMMFMLWASEVKGDEIEEIVVTAQQEKTVKADPLIDNRLIDAIMPMFTYNAGGYGGFIGYRERGAQTNHTAVFVNGIPANDPGAGWYDFGHDFANGQTVKVISGANSVIYGSGSMAGTVLIQDTIERGMNIRLEGEPKQYRIAPIEQLEFSMVKDNFASARNDNDEIDSYENKTARFNVDLGDFTIVGKYVDYEYEYDNCYNYDWQQSNDCLQDGERYNFAIRNDFMTVGRNYNSADYFTNDVSNDGTFPHQDQTYANESYRDFVRFGNNMNLSKNLSVAFGFDAEKIYYNTNSWSNVEGSIEVQTEITEPGIYYADTDTNKARPLWTGEYIGTGDFDISYIGDGVFTLTESVNRYTDENAGLYFSANANFVLNYNFGVRVGNDNQNALRLGISQGNWFFNAGNSFRKPNLYELYGDSYVKGNIDLDPEEGVGFELGYGAISIFRYEFNESITYVPGYNTDILTTTMELDAEATLFVDPDDPTNNGPGAGCVLNPNWTENDEATFELPGCIYKSVTNTESIWTMATYQNTGEYITQGIRYANMFGPVSVMLNYTDSEQPRVPEFSGAIGYEQSFRDFVFKINYAVQLNREPGEFDVLPEGQEFLDDLEKLDFYVTKEFDNGVSLAFKVENVTDEVVEVTPYYDTRGRELNLTLGYKW